MKKNYKRNLLFDFAFAILLFIREWSVSNLSVVLGSFISAASTITATAIFSIKLGANMIGIFKNNSKIAKRNIIYLLSLAILLTFRNYGLDYLSNEIALLFSPITTITIIGLMAENTIFNAIHLARKDGKRDQIIEKPVSLETVNMIDTKSKDFEKGKMVTLVSNKHLSNSSDKQKIRVLK